MEKQILTSEALNYKGERNQPISIWIDGKYKGNAICVQKEPNPGGKIVRVVKDENGHMQVVPSKEIRVIYVCGKSGSGKSTWVAQYIKKYLGLFPEAKFFLFSLKLEDAPLDALKPVRVKIDDSLISDPIKVDDFPNGSIVLFDDIDNIHDKKQQLAIDTLTARLMEIGRSKDIKVLATSHLANPNEKKKSRTLLNEMQSVTIFPKTGSDYQYTYLLKTYFGIPTKVIENILDLPNTRWIMITNQVPALLITEHEIHFLHDFQKSVLSQSKVKETKNIISKPIYEEPRYEDSYSLSSEDGYETYHHRAPERARFFQNGGSPFQHRY